MRTLYRQADATRPAHSANSARDHSKRKLGVIPLSDGAGDVEAIGEGCEAAVRDGDTMRVTGEIAHLPIAGPAAIGAVVDPSSTRLQELAGRHHRGMAEYGDQVALAAGFDAQHAKPVLFVVEGDALNNTGQGLDRRARLHCGATGRILARQRWA